MGTGVDVEAGSLAGLDMSAVDWWRYGLLESRASLGCEEGAGSVVGCSVSDSWKRSASAEAGQSMAFGVLC